MENSMMDNPSTEIAKKALAVFLNRSIQDIDCTLVKGGLDEGVVVSCVCQNKNYIVKMFNNRLSGQQEIAWTEHAFALGIGPQLYAADPLGSYLILEFVEGVFLNPQLADDPIVLGTIAKSLKKLHHSVVSFSQPTQIFPRIEIKYKELNHSGELKRLLESSNLSINKLRAHIESVNVPDVPCHHDLNPRNLFLEAERLVIIDWGDAALGNPYYDIATLCVLNEIDAVGQDLFFDAYDSKLLKPDWRSYFQSLKKIVYFEFALNLLLGLQVKNLPKMSDIHSLNHYLVHFAKSETVLDSKFLFSMAIASLNRIETI